MRLIFFFTFILFVSNTQVSFSLDTNDHLFVLNDIELELLGGQIPLCSGDQLDLENLPIRDLNGTSMDDITLTFWLDQACTNQITTQNNNVFTSDISIWAKGEYQGCVNVLEVPIILLDSPELIFNQDNIVVCQGEDVVLGDINIINNSSFGSEINFYWSNVIDIENLIDARTISTDVGLTTIFAHSGHEQCDFILPITITTSPAPELVIATQPLICSGLSLNLEELVITDVNNSGVPFTFYTQDPFIAANEITVSVLNPTQDQTIFAVANFGTCVSVLPIEISVETSFFAGNDDSFEFCAEDGLLDLNDLLAPDVDPGMWLSMTANDYFDPLTNTFNTDESPPASYLFNYVIDSEGACAGDEAVYELVITQSPQAGENTMIAHCFSDNNLVNLFNSIDDDRETTGIFVQTDGPSLAIVNPVAQDLSGNSPGEYTYEYIVEGISPCDPDTSILIIDIVSDPDTFDLEYKCNQNLTAYTVIFLTDANSVLPTDPSNGSVSNTAVAVGEDRLSEFTVSDVPIANEIELIFTTPSGCQITNIIPPPVCTCPFVERPVNEGDVKVCLPDPVRPLIVDVEDWQGVDWFDAFEDGDELLSNSTEFISPETEVGTYFYWAEAYSLANPDCRSEERTLVTLFIAETPDVENIEIPGCSDDTNVIYNLEEGATQYGPDYFTSFYIQFDEATIGENALDLDYNSSATTGQIIYARVENEAGCFDVNQVTLNPNPIPDVEFNIFQITCGSPSGSIQIVNNDPSQQLDIIVNGGPNSGLTVGNLGAGVNAIIVQNQYGCAIDSLVAITTGFEFDEEEYGCSDNDTPGNDTDDFVLYEFLVNAPGTGTQFQLLRFDVGDGFNHLNEDTWLDLGIFDYGKFTSLSFDIDQETWTYVFRDLDDPTCFIRRIQREQTTCSDMCGINEAIIHFDPDNCDDGGTDTDHLDDTVTFGIEASGSNLGDFWFLEGDPSTSADYGDIIEIGPVPLSILPDTLFLVDEITDTCVYPLTTFELRTCSDGCDILGIQIFQIECDSVDTPFDNTDDLYTVQFSASNTHPGRVHYYALYLGEEYGPFTYNNPGRIDSLLAINQEINLVFRDEFDLQCTANAPTLNITPCSDCFQAISIEEDIQLNCKADPVQVQLQISEEGTYQWTNAADDSLISNELAPFFQTPGTYYLEVEYENGCTSKDTLEVVMDFENPVISPINDLVLTCDNQEVTLNSESTQQADIDYSWIDENGIVVSIEPNFTTSKIGTYTIITTNRETLCESDPVSVVVTENQVLPTVNEITANPGTEINCQFENITLSPSNTNINYEYEWSFDDQNIISENLEVSDIGEYMLTVIDTENGCTQELAMEITRSVDFPPVVYPLPDTITCLNQSSEISIDGSLIESFMEVTWYDQNDQQIMSPDLFVLEVTQPGIFTVEVYNPQNDCRSIEEIEIFENVDPPVFNLGQDTFVPCDQNFITLQPNIVDPSLNLEYAWSNSENNSFSDQNVSIDITELAEYYLQLINMDNLCSSFDTIVVEENPFQINDVSFVVDQIECFGEEEGSIQISNIEGHSSNLEILMNGGSQDTDAFENLTSGEYIFQLTNDKNCEYRDTIILNSPEEIFLNLFPIPEMSYELGDTIDLVADISIPDSNILDLSWNFDDEIVCDDCLETQVILNQSGFYEFNFVDIFGCEISDGLSFFVDTRIKDYFIPDIISCSTDDDNGTFMIFGDKQIERVNLISIFDRWGNTIFESSNFEPGDISKGWNCATDNRNISSGVYVYKIDVTAIDGQPRTFKGSFTVIK